MHGRDELIAKARALRADATGGKWKAWGYLNGNPEIASAPGDGRMESIATVISFDRRKENQAFIAGAAELLPALADLAESEGRRADRESETLLKIAAAFNGWANAGPPDGGPSNAITAATVLEKIGEALGDPLKGQQP